jgi:hypothetical protein
MTNLPEKIYTESEVERARSSAQLVGWLQGAGIVIAGGVLWNLLGWIPVLLGVGLVAWVLYKLFGRTDDGGPEG